MQRDGRTKVSEWKRGMVLCVEQVPETRRRCFAAPASLPADIQGVFQAGDGTCCPRNSKEMAQW
jgi:hypothetical protein